jgi:NADH dehydrogenase
MTLERPRVVVLGGGFGGLAAAKALAGRPVEVTLVDRANHHTFQPLLYQVATTVLSPGQIAVPLRWALRRARNVAVVLGEVTGVDLAGRKVRLASAPDDDRPPVVPYDYLIVATGARHGYFGNDRWEGVAPGLKKIDDATDIRRRILTAFEKAENTDDPAERDRWLTFAVIGAGPTGVELAGAIAELARNGLARNFRRIDPASARVLLIEAGPRVLSAFPERLSLKAARQLEKLGVEVRTGSAVTDCDEQGVTLGSQRIPTGCILWAAGVAASPAAKWLGAEADRAGRVKVTPALTLPGHPEIFVIGDTASVTQADGRLVPGVAPAAKQMGGYVARGFRRSISGDPVRPIFRSRAVGNLATSGRKAGVAECGRLRLCGFPAWLLGGVAQV